MIELEPLRRTAQDREFAYRLKRDALGPHVAPRWGWDEPYQRGVHRERWERKTFYRIVRDGEAIGTLALDEAGDCLRFGEFYIRPELQGRGLGTEVLRLVLARADAAGRPVRLEYLKWNPAGSLYRRHGFVMKGETEIHYLMERPARATAEA